MVIPQSIATLLDQIYKAESALPLHNQACRSRFWVHPHRTSKVLLFLHGFTAAPYQSEPIGNAFFKAGYTVLAPLQPGHGQAGNWNRHNPPPLPEEIEPYQQFVLQWLQVAQTLGEQVVIGGLSTGGTLAAWAALQHPQQVNHALLFTPFLGSRYRLFDGLIHTLPFYFEWFNKDASGNFGYKGFRIPALRIFLELGRDVVEQAQIRAEVPILMVCSESDRAVNRAKQQDLFQAIVTHQPRSWYYCFDDSLNIEHRMMTRLEDNDYEELVIALARAYVESDLTWNEFQQFAMQVNRQKTGAVNSNEEQLRFLPRSNGQDKTPPLNLDAQLLAQLQNLITRRFGCQKLDCISPTKP